MFRLFASELHAPQHCALELFVLGLFFEAPSKSFRFAEFSRTIREDFAPLHIRRKKFERSTNVFSLPLPWRPGWRNLVMGRAMGGNRYLSQRGVYAKLNEQGCALQPAVVC